MRFQNASNKLHVLLEVLLRFVIQIHKLRRGTVTQNFVYIKIGSSSREHNIISLILYKEPIKLQHKKFYISSFPVYYTPDFENCIIVSQCIIRRVKLKTRLSGFKFCFCHIPELWSKTKYVMYRSYGVYLTYFAPGSIPSTIDDTLPLPRSDP